MTGDIVYNSEIKMWWPRYDRGAVACYHYVMNRIHDMDHAIRLCEPKVCIQAGGHVGLWPGRLSQHFEQVFTFEPDPNCYEALARNCALRRNISARPLALGADLEFKKMRRAPTAGSWRIDEVGDFTIDVTTIDCHDYQRVDAIFLDVEGYEVEALRGGARTIEKFRPVLHLELWDRRRSELEGYLESIRYRPVHKIHGDVVYVPAERTP